MKAKLERCDDAEVSTAATNRPKKVFVCGRTRCHVCAVGIDQVGRDDIVATETVLAHEPANATSESEPRHSCGGNDTAGCCQAIAFSGLVEFSPRYPALNDRRLPGRVYLDGFHPRQIDHHRAVCN